MGFFSVGTGKGVDASFVEQTGLCEGTFVSAGEISADTGWDKCRDHRMNINGWKDRNTKVFLFLL